MGAGAEAAAAREPLVGAVVVNYNGAAVTRACVDSLRRGDGPPVHVVIADKPPLALRLAKECVLQAFEAPLEQGLELERRAFLFLAATEDRREGIEAFLAKRPPRFEGR